MDAPRLRVGRVRRLALAMEEGLHDYVEVTLENYNPAVINNYAGKAVRIDTLLGNVPRSYVGYLDIAAPRLDRGFVTVLPSVHILGATSICRSGQQRIWHKVDPFDIASQVLAPYQLGLEMDRYPQLLHTMGQTSDESDWKFLRRLAQRLGYSLTSDGTTVRLLDVQKELQRCRSKVHNVYSIPANAAGEANINTFTVEATGAPSDAQYTRTKMRGVDRWGVQFSYDTAFTKGQSAGIAPTLTIESGQSYRSLQEAMTEADRVNRQARFVYKATLTTNSLRHEHPGSFAEFVDETRTYSGLWYVTEVKHEIDIAATKTITSVSAVREALEGDRRPLPALRDPRKFAPPTPRFFQGAWRSSKQWVVEL